jgi:hypothetical protein
LIALISAERGNLRDEVTDNPEVERLAARDNRIERLGDQNRDYGRALQLDVRDCW